MNESEAIVTSWREMTARGESAVLATVVDVKGSAYRRPGARMLLGRSGQRVGSISGGCLEGDVSKKAWWWTEDRRATVRTYDTTADEDTVWELGLGCNGTVKVMLERADTDGAGELLEFVDACRKGRRWGAAAVVIGGNDTRVGERLFFTEDGCTSGSAEMARAGSLVAHVRQALAEGASRVTYWGAAEVFIEVIAPPTALVIFGAGHDAVPLVRCAKDLGWHVTVADGRQSFAQRRRFPLADEVILTSPSDLFAGVPLTAETAAVVMNHSYAIDREITASLLMRGLPYVGVLGPRNRTTKILRDLGIERAPECLHAPIGLDLGADSPEGIALSIAAEIQAVWNGRCGGMLRERNGPIYDQTQSLCETPHAAVA